ncbi:MAG TPA: DUF4249 domain-containing protein [Bacteroidetes bacterium]|nr:DUF4249 domain-containing protein [Bacteroidota bacterium]
MLLSNYLILNFSNSVKMKIYNCIFFFSAILFFASCSEDFFEQTVDIDIPEHTPQLAVTSQLSSGDTMLWAFLTPSQGILDNTAAQPIEDATVELFRNGQLMETLFYSGERFYTSISNTPLPTDADEYILKVSAPGFDPIEVVQQMPAPVPIISATYEAGGAIDIDGERVDEVSVEFVDPAGEDNYYQMTIVIEVERQNGGFTNSPYIYKLDPIAEELDNGQYLKDDSFDGKKYVWRVGFYEQHFDPNQSVKIHVQLSSVSRDQYFYERSVYLSVDADDNPFAEPVIIHSNVEGGQGVFTLSSKSVEVIEL